MVLESAGIAGSKWVEHEMAIARSRRLGLVGVHLPGGVPLAQVRSPCRIEVRRSELRGKAPDWRLESIAARRVVGEIKALHGKALLHRRRVLHRAMSVALHLCGARDVRAVAGGVLEAKPGAASTPTYAILLTPRLPELPDFHAVSMHAGSATGVVVGPCAFFEPARRARLDWLANKSDIHYRDEAELLPVAREIAAGNL